MALIFFLRAFFSIYSVCGSSLLLPCLSIYAPARMCARHSLQIAVAQLASSKCNRYPPTNPFSNQFPFPNQPAMTVQSILPIHCFRLSLSFSQFLSLNQFLDIQSIHESVNQLFKFQSNHSQVSKHWVTLSFRISYTSPSPSLSVLSLCTSPIHRRQTEWPRAFWYISRYGIEGLEEIFILFDWNSILDRQIFDFFEARFRCNIAKRKISTKGSSCKTSHQRS